MNLSRRQLLAASSVAGVALALPEAATASVVRRDRPALPSGIMSGDVTANSAVVWSRTDRKARLVVDLTSHGRFDRAIRLRGPVTGPDADYTAQLPLKGLRPGQRYDYRIAFEDAYGRRGESQAGSFVTPGRNRGVSFVWTGDTAGQGYGINPDFGGMIAYKAMHRTRPDFFLHSGDNIYADGPIAAEVKIPDGTVWKNVVTEEVAKVAETLAEYRGRYKYNLLDQNVRDLYADVPVISQWDDHETVNNWYPGEILEDSRYTERRVDVLAARARKAFLEYLPMAHTAGRNRIYRKVSYGPLLDVFCLDMRTYRDTNPAPGATGPVAILGAEQAQWLVREVASSKATWKVIASDMPLGVLVPDGPLIEAVANGVAGAPGGREHEIAWVLSQFKKRKVRNAVWLTADVHYCAAHHYDPSRAAFTDFDPFWEIVAGPVNAGTFGPNALDPTFGPKVEFVKAADFPNQPPSGGNQFFGHVAIDPRTGVFTASLRDLYGKVLWTKDLNPARH
ncbi:alkaline phosphatase [Kribbella sandramycini]|uniref:Alkaline phosphatase n=1 Tax=Kribbella sandramycini TaxID=60450 RepID=A0A7Y4KU55_9ACTN|nr:alkaline phosphatase D family protein [Kribbella sandramycini]MBB6568670.1 alkaline phosphatase D [Kribbella sandramycini]NOL38744.1 alkaline phosphatase [Kribbella sandramycini]